jgi:hypothetical protein
MAQRSSELAQGLLGQPRRHGSSLPLLQQARSSDASLQCERCREGLLSSYFAQQVEVGRHPLTGFQRELKEWWVGGVCSPDSEKGPGFGGEWMRSSQAPTRRHVDLHLHMPELYIALSATSLGAMVHSIMASSI